VKKILGVHEDQTALYVDKWDENAQTIISCAVQHTVKHHHP
jgi:hypothetical protein